MIAALNVGTLLRPALFQRRSRLSRRRCCPANWSRAAQNDARGPDHKRLLVPIIQGLQRTILQSFIATTFRLHIVLLTAGELEPFGGITSVSRANQAAAFESSPGMMPSLSQRCKVAGLEWPELDFQRRTWTMPRGEE